MALTFSPYLNFDGNCREAFEHYHSVLGGELFVIGRDDIPAEEEVGPEWEGRTVHAALKIDDALLMASDIPPGMPFDGMRGVYVNLGVGTVEEAERVWAALAEGATVEMPLAPTFFAPAFGSLVDRFGTPWMINSAPVEDGG
jgi:PhnB protein